MIFIINPTIIPPAPETMHKICYSIVSGVDRNDYPPSYINENWTTTVTIMTPVK